MVQSTSLEHPYQRSSLRCSEGRGGIIVAIFFKQLHAWKGRSDPKVLDINALVGIHICMHNIFLISLWYTAQLIMSVWHFRAFACGLTIFSILCKLLFFTIHVIVKTAM